MRVISEQKKINRVECEWCKALLEYEPEDLEYKELGCAYVKCPLCHKESMVDEEINLTPENIEFPKHFHHFHQSVEGAKHISIGEIYNQVRLGMQYLKNNPNEYLWYTMTGDTLIWVSTEDESDMYDFGFTQDFYETLVRGKDWLDI